MSQQFRRATLWKQSTQILWVSGSICWGKKLLATRIGFLELDVKISSPDGNQRARAMYISRMQVSYISHFQVRKPCRIFLTHTLQCRPITPMSVSLGVYTELDEMGNLFLRYDKNHSLNENSRWRGAFLQYEQNVQHGRACRAPPSGLAMLSCHHVERLLCGALGLRQRKAPWPLLSPKQGGDTHVLPQCDFSVVLC